MYLKLGGGIVGPGQAAGKEVTVPASPAKEGESESEHGTAEQEVLLRCVLFCFDLGE